MAWWWLVQRPQFNHLDHPRITPNKPRIIISTIVLLCLVLLLLSLLLSQALLVLTILYQNFYHYS